MDKQMVREWKARWQAVNERQAQDVQTMSMADRWHKFVGILHIAAAMGLKRHVNEDEINAVRSRWAYLRRLAEESRRAGEDK